MTRASHILCRIAVELGPLRLMLAILVLVVSIASPFSEGPAVYTGWRLATTVIAPAIFVMLVFLLPLDMIMSMVFMSGGSSVTRARFRRIIAIEFMLLVAMMIAWLPFVFRLLNPPSS